MNILFITADQWRGECLSALGHPVVRTPHLDALAREGVLFANHFANAVPCGPSRASLHTGMYLQNHRSATNGTPLDARHTNWAKEAARAGYDPVLFGYTDTSVDPRAVEADDPWLKTYEGPLPGIRPLVMMGDRPVAWTDRLKAGGYFVPQDISLAYSLRADGPDYEDGAPVPARSPIRPKRTTPISWSTAASIISARHAHRSSRIFPFCARIRPSSRPSPTTRCTILWPFRALRVWPRQKGKGTQHPWLAHQLSRSAFRAPANDKKLRRLKAVYYGLMSAVDAAIGRIVAFLKESGRWDETMIVFTSDHGEQMGDHWLLGKGGYFDASYRIPLIVRDPRREADGARGGVVEHFTENVDIMPTMLDALGLAIPVQCDGLSLRLFLEGAGAPANWRREAHWEFDFRDPADDTAEKTLGLTLHQCTMNVIRDARYKYVHFTKLPPLFFDLKEDPGEFVDRAGDPAYQGRMLAYAQKLLSWRMNHDEQTLTHIALTGAGPVARRADAINWGKERGR